MKRELIVSAIENGTVIDHVAPGRALDVVRILNLEGFGDSVALVMNAPSGKIGRKDVVKIASRALSESEVNEIALVAPSATLSIIKNCISRKEGTPRFIVEKRSPVILRCYYCERLILEDDIAGRGKG
jgi:aspartate carbamoyltransferase regulatory subunit